MRSRSTQIDPITPRPVGVEAKRTLIRQVYQWNGWTAPEHKTNTALIGVPLKAINDYTEAECDIFLNDFEARKMILFP
jgi:hypothetical protein